jgi:hypothetical protein
MGYAVAANAVVSMFTLGDRMKRLEYRGGLVRFELPSHWVEEYEPEGGGTFYDNTIEAVMLRLNVLSFQAPQPIGVGDAIVAARQSAKQGFVVEALATEQALCIEPPKLFEEQGEALELHTWRLYRVVASAQMLRIAVFSATVIVAERDAEKTRTILALIDRAVRGAVVSAAPGVSVH